MSGDCVARCRVRCPRAHARTAKTDEALRASSTQTLRKVRDENPRSSSVGSLEWRTRIGTDTAFESVKEC